MTAQNPGGGPAPAAAAGWYPDPYGAGALMRRWTGTAWSEEVRPYVQPPPPAAKAAAVPVRSAWAVAWIGAGWAAIAAWLADGTSLTAGACTGIGAFAALVVGVVFAEMDSRALKEAGEPPVTSWSAIGLSPLIYLLLRARKLRGKGGAWRIFATGLAVWLAGGVLAVTAAASLTPNPAASGSYPACTTSACIAAEIEQSLAGGVVKDGSVMTTLKCKPSTVKRNPGGTWTASCTATYSDGTSATGFGNLLPAQNKVTFEPVTMAG